MNTLINSLKAGNSNKANAKITKTKKCYTRLGGGELGADCSG
jgi:hypothetical protein